MNDNPEEGVDNLEEVADRRKAKGKERAVLYSMSPPKSLQPTVEHVSENFDEINVWGFRWGTWRF